MDVKPGDIVRLAGNVIVRVTSAVDQNHENVKENPDDLFIGYQLKYSPVSDKYFRSRDSKLIINPMSEVIAIENDIVVE